MNNFLLINPRGSVRDLPSKLNSEKVKCYAVITDSTRNFLTTDQLNKLEVYTPETLPTDLEFVSTISSDVFGHKFQETLIKQGKVKFANAPGLSDNRIKSFVVGKPKEASCRVVEVFSFFGRHVVSSAWQVQDGTNYSLLDPYHVDNWNDLVDLAFDKLETLGYSNGPSQVFIDDNNSIIGFKAQMIDWMDSQLGEELTGRSWLTQFPTLIEDPNNQDKGFFKRFYEWSRAIGNNRSYAKLKDYSNKV